MGRFSTTFRPPPVRISRAQARSEQGILLLDAQRTARGAGGFGQREARFASVPVQLRIDRGEGPSRSGAMPIGTTRRKRGYAPIPLAAQHVVGE